jgi:hypothetical protein
MSPSMRIAETQPPKPAERRDLAPGSPEAC